MAVGEHRHPREQADERGDFCLEGQASVVDDDRLNDSMAERSTDIVAPLAVDGPATVATPALVIVRLACLDALKVVAMCAVVSIHIYGVSFNTREAESLGWWLANVLYTGSRWSVPIFVMASGALLPRRPPDAGTFSRRRFGKILPATAVFVPAYFVFAAVLGTPLTLSAIAAGLASGRPYNYLYFLAIIGGLYAVTPLLQATLHSASRRSSGERVWVCSP